MLTASGTVALALAFLAAAPPGRRPRVALPAWGCYDLMTAADAADAEVLLYDLDPGTLAPVLPGFEAALSRGVHAAVVVHWFGLPIDLAPFSALAWQAGAFLVDDAAQAVGATLDGEPAGSVGEFGILSFGRGKGRTGGSGGALLAGNREAEQRLGTVVSRLTGGRAPLTSIRLGVQYVLGRPSLYWIPNLLPGTGLGETVYREAPPLQAMAPEAAASLERNWEASMQGVLVRRVNAARWQELLARVPDVTPVTAAKHGQPGWLRFPLLAKGAARERLSGPKARRFGVMPGYPATLGSLPVASGRIVFSPDNPAGASLLSQSLYTLPTHEQTGHRDFDAVTGMLQGD